MANGKLIRHDLTDRKFGRLIAIERVDRPGASMWRCKCECGKEHIVRASSLLDGNTKSCGCLVVKHGHCRVSGKTREFRSWMHARARCFDRNDIKYTEYGGRGISMCTEWREDFRIFLKDMGICPPGMTIDRIDTNGHYEPLNCRWSTPKQQSRNTRRNHLITINGVTKCLAEWSESVGMKLHTFRNRIINLGWTPEEALSTPVRGIS